MKAPWQRHESGMKATWIWDEYDMMDLNNFGVFKGKCHESAMKNCPNPLYHILVIFISDSCHFHGTFMALSWHFHGTLTATSRKTWLQTFHAIFMADSWDFHGTFYHFKTVMLKYIRFMSLSCHFHGTFFQSSRLSCLSCRQSAMKLPWNCLELCLVESDMKVTWIRDESDIAVKLTWKWHESAMNPRWICDESDIQARLSFLRWIQLLIWIIFSWKNSKSGCRKCHESAMKVPWNLHESDILQKIK